MGASATATTVISSPTAQYANIHFNGFRTVRPADRSVIFPRGGISSGCFGGFACRLGIVSPLTPHPRLIPPQTRAMPSTDKHVRTQ
ncbi:MAG TPA: hypothetical protein PKE29_03125 [Phycisphaerales bacterium]|nr:hypothetical protein [Phycisphaerales bacterium]